MNKDTIHINILSHPYNRSSKGYGEWLEEKGLGKYKWNDISKFYKKFCEILLKYSNITEKDNPLIYTGNNVQYNIALNYYANGQTDDATVNIMQILNSTTTYESNKLPSCGCNGSTNATSTSNISCLDTYKSGLSEYLKKALGNDQFYIDWCCNTTEDGRICPDLFVLEPLKQILWDLILDVVEGRKELIFDNKKRKYVCGCSDTNSNNVEHDLNLKILKNYYKVLYWVSTCKIDQNINKIKIYGEAFAELLPKLNF